MSDEKYVISTTGGPTTVTLPDAANWPRDKDGNPREIIIRNLGSHPLTICDGGRQTLVYPSEDKPIKFLNS